MQVIRPPSIFATEGNPLERSIQFNTPGPYHISQRSRDYRLAISAPSSFLIYRKATDAHISRNARSRGQTEHIVFEGAVQRQDRVNVGTSTDRAAYDRAVWAGRTLNFLRYIMLGQIGLASSSSSPLGGPPSPSISLPNSLTTTPSHDKRDVYPPPRY